MKNMIFGRGKRVQEEIEVQIRVSLIGRILLIFVLGLFILFPREKEFEITFLDVGQGDGIYISAGNGSTCFIDGGSSSVKEVGRYRILPFLKSKGIASIDYWFVTHADADHVSGLLEILESGYQIRNVVVSQACPKDENDIALQQAVKNAGAKFLIMKAHTKLTLGDMSLTCLYPSKQEFTDRNEASLVLLLEKDMDGLKEPFRAWFAGDISEQAEQFLLAEELVMDVDLFKVSHHGSKYSNSEAFLAALQPEIAVISCGERNLYGHPHPEVLERLQLVNAAIYNTAIHRQVTITIDGKGRVYCECLLYKSDNYAIMEVNQLFNHSALELKKEIKTNTKPL